MNKKHSHNSLYILCSLILGTLLLSGCFSGESSSPRPKQSLPQTYEYFPTESRFKVISVETIDDGTTNGITLSILVDTETKVMYLQTEKYTSGYGIGLQVMIDKDGKPLLFTDK